MGDARRKALAGYVPTTKRKYDNSELPVRVLVPHKGGRDAARRRERIGTRASVFGTVDWRRKYPKDKFPKE